MLTKILFLKPQTSPWILHCFIEQQLTLKCLNDTEQAKESVKKRGVTIEINDEQLNKTVPLNVSIYIYSIYRFFLCN